MIRPRPLPLASRKSRRLARAVTVLELLVALAGAVILAAAALRIFDETQTASIKMTRRQTGIDFASLALDEIRELLRDAVPPEALDADAARAEFAEDRMTFPAYAGPATGLAQVSLPLLASSLTDGAPDGGMKYELLATPFGGEGETRRRSVGPGFEGIRPRISFRYALESSADGPVRYVKELPPGQWPALVEVAVSIEPEGGGERQVFRTAVVPGRLPQFAGGGPR